MTLQEILALLDYRPSQRLFPVQRTTSVRFNLRPSPRQIAKLVKPKPKKNEMDFSTMKYILNRLERMQNNTSFNPYLAQSVFGKNKQSGGLL